MIRAPRATQRTCPYENRIAATVPRATTNRANVVPPATQSLMCLARPLCRRAMTRDHLDHGGQSRLSRDLEHVVIPIENTTITTITTTDQDVTGPRILLRVLTIGVHLPRPEAAPIMLVLPQLLEQAPVLVLPRTEGLPGHLAEPAALVATPCPQPPRLGYPGGRTP
jgi:hypothetical protein